MQDVTFLTEQDDWKASEFSVIVAPAYKLMQKDILTKWEDYLNGGGDLVLTCLSGHKDNQGQLWRGKTANIIYDLIGAEIDFFDMLPPGKAATINFDGKSYEWNLWGDVLNVKDKSVSVVGSYSDQFYQGKPSIIQKDVGKGKITYVGVLSNGGKVEKDVIQKVMNQKGIDHLTQKDYVFTEWNSGFWVTVNYSSETIEAPVKSDDQIIFGSKKVAPGKFVVWK